MVYDYIIVGSGLYGSIFAYELNKISKKVLVLEKRSHIGGNVFTENVEGINVHKYGAHIFHTNDKEVWDYINQFADFNNYIHNVIAIYKSELYNLPFNMNTFHEMWGIKTPLDAKKIIKSQKSDFKLINKNPSNLEEQAISLVGKDIYEKLIKGYTEKQWGKKCNELPAFIIKRLPVRFTYNNNYFNDSYQGIPVGGYTQIIEKMLNGIDVKLNTDFFQKREKWKNVADKCVFTGMIDQYFSYCYGELEYRSLKFEEEIKNIKNYQGNSVVNYTDFNPSYTRIIEHKHFENLENNDSLAKTVITKEYPQKWKNGMDAYYPINDEKNSKLFDKYKKLANKEENVIFGGRLADYKYYDMWEVIKKAVSNVKEEINNLVP
ncbi:MAG: UDP-galactopyranose mutase [Methanobrevibacter sp.]|jgi:UDP-galactopyranose mutase|nr:UDP-galactopyranose mutase [Candidatus Methanoflexus mossambicus]